MGRNRIDEDDEFEVEGAGLRLAKHVSGGMSSLNLPDKISFFKPKKNGSHMLEFIPFQTTESHFEYPEAKQFVSKVGAWWYERTFWIHRGIGVNNENFVCPAKTIGKPCPVCEDIIKLKDSSHPEDKKRAKNLKPKERQIFLVYDLEDTQKGIQLWELAHYNFGAQLDEYLNKARSQDKDSFNRFYSPKHGLSVRISGKEEMLPGNDGGPPMANTIYSVYQFYDREEEVPIKLFKHGHNLDNMVKILSYKELNNQYLGKIEEGEKTDDRDRDRPRKPVKEEPEPEPEEPKKEKAKPKVKQEEPEPEPEEPKKEKAKPKEEPKKQTFGTGDMVSFELDGKEYTLKVTKVNFEKEIAHIQIPGRERAYIAGFHELTLIDPDTFFDAKAEDTKEKKSSKWDKDKDKDDENDAEKSFRKKDDDDDDNDPPPKKRGRPKNS